MLCYSKFSGYDGLPVRRSCLSMTDWKSVVQLNTTPILSCHKALQTWEFLSMTRQTSAGILVRSAKRLGTFAPADRLIQRRNGASGVVVNDSEIEKTLFGDRLSAKSKAATSRRTPGWRCPVSVHANGWKFSSGSPGDVMSLRFGWENTPLVRSSGSSSCSGFRKLHCFGQSL